MQIAPNMMPPRPPQFGERVKADGDAALASLGATSVGGAASVGITTTAASGAASAAAGTVGSGLETAGLAQISSGPESSAADSAHDLIAELESAGGDKAAEWSAENRSAGGAAMSVAGSAIGGLGSGGAKTTLKSPSR